MSDLVIRGGDVVFADRVATADVAIEAGVVVAVGPELPGAPREIDARGLHVFPGGIDPHVHFDDPGREHWEGIESGSRSLAAGGFTTFVDMPLNNDPVTVDGATFDHKLTAIRDRSYVDFALWGGLVAGNADRLAEQAERGAIGFKAFMCHSGIDDFPGVDDISLYDGMERIAELGSVLLLHAENAQLVAELGVRARAAGTLGPRDFVAARPPVSELEAISRAVVMSEATGCRTHIVHVSLARGVEIVAEAAARGVDVTCETCPHFLLYTDDDLERIGLPLKSAPPVRSARDRDRLWALVADGTLLMVTSDHSPGSPDVKQAGFWDSWGGISGCQSTLQLLLEAGYRQRGLSLPTIAELVGGSAARRFRLHGKGLVAPGADADLALVDLAWHGTVRREDLHYRHATSAYERLPIRGRIVRTLLRGETVYDGRRFVDTPTGRFLRAAR